MKKIKNFSQPRGRPYGDSLLLRSYGYRRAQALIIDNNFCRFALVDDDSLVDRGMLKRREIAEQITCL